LVTIGYFSKKLLSGAMAKIHKSRFEIWSIRFVLVLYLFGFIWLTVWLTSGDENFFEEDYKYDNGAFVCPVEKTPHTDENNGC
jgi:hypothetical protein